MTKGVREIAHPLWYVVNYSSSVFSLFSVVGTAVFFLKRIQETQVAPTSAAATTPPIITKTIAGVQV